MKIYKQLLVETETISEHDLLPLFEEIGLDTKTYTVSYLAEQVGFISTLNETSSSEKKARSAEFSQQFLYNRYQNSNNWNPVVWSLKNNENKANIKKFKSGREASSLIAQAKNETDPNKKAELLAKSKVLIKDGQNAKFISKNPRPNDENLIGQIRRIKIEKEKELQRSEDPWQRKYRLKRMSEKDRLKTAEDRMSEKDRLKTAEDRMSEKDR